jgi:hypothetical protein
MTRSIVAVWSAGVALMALSILSALSTLGCQATHVGDPCTPEQEYDKSFLGFSQTEVSVESRSFQCETRLCLVDHFQGRVSCPYGQAIDGGANGAPPVTPCVTPATNIPVDGKDPNGMIVDSTHQALVLPQCVDRTAANAVYCSCRCANAAGATNDGANYCQCPDGFSCTQLVPSIGATDQGLTGAYCVKSSAPYAPNVCTTSPATLCTPAMANCGSAQGVTAP